MKITKISLTNFRSFKVTQTIELAPVTLLFGPNSVGKSSVLLALFYLKHILDTGDCNPQRITALNNKYVGGFENLVHGRSLDERITIKVEFDKSGVVGSSYGFLSGLFESVDLFDQIDVGVSSPSVEAGSMAVEVDIAWSRSMRAAYVSRYKVIFDGEDICEVSSDAGLKQPMVVAINYFHPLLLPDDLDEKLLSDFDDRTPIHDDFLDRICELKGIDVPSHLEIADRAEAPFRNDDDDTPEFTSTAYVSKFHEVLNEGRNPSDKVVANVNFTGFADHEFIHIPIGIDGMVGALPLPGKRLSTTLDLDNQNQTELLIEILSDLVVSPLDNLKELFNSSVCIGPIREIPEYINARADSLKREDWYSGLAAWEAIKSIDLKTIREIDKWMSDPTKLDLGVGIALRLSKHFTEYKRVLSEVDFRLMSDQLDQHLEKYFGSPDDKPTNIRIDRVDESRSYTLWDLARNFSVSPGDLGVGISQLMPLVVAALCRKGGFVAIEQPELHVHPRIQTATGDLITQANRNISFVVETHSEHLILRLLKRIRQTYSSELPDGYVPVKDSDVSVMYLEPTSNGVVARRIRIDEEGEFKDRWPRGFYIERREELL